MSNWLWRGLRSGVRTTGYPSAPEAAAGVSPGFPLGATMEPGPAAALEPGQVTVAVPARSGAALGAVEAPRGAAFHWLRLDDDGKVRRYRIMPPSFANWHGFHLAVEDFAFQDLPIILATLDLSVAENDR